MLLRPSAAGSAGQKSGISLTVLRRQGENGKPTYRIPGLTTTARGTLIAVFDTRHEGAGDLPAPITITAMRSEDNGNTWSSPQTALQFDKNEPGARGNGVGDPAVLFDPKRNQVVVIGLWAHGDRGWNGSGPGLTPDETGQLVLARSKDNGKTWSSPVNITASLRNRKRDWRLCFNGPGAGVALSDGTLLFAAQYRDSDGTPHSAFIYSTDGGNTWTISPPAIPTLPPTSEAQIAPLKDGSLLLTMRDESHSGKRAWARFIWDGNPKSIGKGAWDTFYHTVPDPTCMASLVRHPSGLLLFTNPNSEKRRVALTIRVSRDEGKTWSHGKVIDTRPCAYSCLTILKDGSVGVLYECGDKTPYETLTFARFPLQWALDAA